MNCVTSNLLIWLEFLATNYTNFQSEASLWDKKIFVLIGANSWQSF